MIAKVHPDDTPHPCLYCAADPKTLGFQRKSAWYKARFEEGLRILVSPSARGGPGAFLEYVPIENAWRPVEGHEWLFVHCVMTRRRADRRVGLARGLLATCEDEAREQNLAGVAAMTSEGTWMAGTDLFKRTGYEPVDARGRFKLMVKDLRGGSDPPRIRDWSRQLPKYQGWHLLWADQCPWHISSVTALGQEAREWGVDLKVTHLETPGKAQRAPCGTGVFALVRDGRLLEDHYLSRTRFRNILRKELAA